jgi:hypothetical protein
LRNKPLMHVKNWQWLILVAQQVPLNLESKQLNLIATWLT